MIFFVGMHNLQKLHLIPQVCISSVRLKNRQKDITPNDWILDSGAFSQISHWGEYQVSCADYVKSAKRWSKCGNLLAVVSQDYMCEPEILQRCGSTVESQQRKTIERFRRLLDMWDTDTYLMPVLQGWLQDDYLRHIEMYGDLLPESAWAGVGSICRRQGTKDMAKIIGGIVRERKDLRLHAFGAKTLALASPLLNLWLYSADSSAWSYAARREGRDANCIDEALRFWQRINSYDAGLFEVLRVN